MLRILLGDNVAPDRKTAFHLDSRFGDFHEFGGIITYFPLGATSRLPGERLRAESLLCPPRCDWFRVERASCRFIALTPGGAVAGMNIGKEKSQIYEQ